MARASISRTVRRALARFIAPELTRGYDAASWKRFPREARSHRTSTETIAAASAIRARARYYVANEAFAAAGVSALVTYGWGCGAMASHPNADAFNNDWWNRCDADGRTDFGGLIALLVRALVIDGEALVLFRQGPDGLKLQALPSEQLDESLTRELGGGAFIAAGIEFDAQGARVAYWIRPFLPTQQFETYAPPVRVDAADLIHVMRPDGIGQVRGVSWLAPILLKLADLGLLSDALLKGFQVAATRSESATLVVLYVHDCGAGLAPELAEKIFEPLFTTKIGGTGLGLFISRVIVETHHGHLHARENKDGGATFSLSIPKCRTDSRVQGSRGKP